jgi:hypothetical protein
MMVLSFLQFRLVVKTALKLLLVFVEYSESNAPLLIQAVSVVDTKRGEWSPLPTSTELGRLPHLMSLKQNEERTKLACAWTSACRKHLVG